MKNRYVSTTRLSVFILLSLFLVALPVPAVHAQDIFGFVTYNYTSFFHIASYHPANPNGVAVILVPGGGVPSLMHSGYYLQPPGMHPDYPVFINNLTAKGYIVLMPYSDSYESLDNWKTFLDFTINITVHNPKIKRTIVVAHSAGGMVTFSYFVNKVQPLVSDILYFNSPLVFSDVSCAFLDCSKINTKSSFIFGKNDYTVMGQSQTCNGKVFWQYDAINYCSSSGNNNIKIMIMNPGYGHSPFGDNNSNVGLPIFLLIANGGGLLQPNPTCQSDCTFGNTGVCTASCSGVNGCTNFHSACSNFNKGTLGCADNYNYATCCNGAPISCSGTTTINCPSSFCNTTTGQLCFYQSSTASCKKSCAVGSCQCIPSCGNPTCVTCGAGLTCNPNYNKCMTICVRGQACPNEQAPSMPVSNTWNFAIVILAIIGLCLGYLILKEAISTETTKTKKKRRK